jgi:hypothetical protein
MRHYLSSTYITAEKLEPGVRYEHTIIGVSDFTFPGDEKPTAILHLQTGEQLTLNQTRLRAIAAGFGWNDENWVGQMIIVYLGKAPFQGKIVDAAAVEPVVPDRIAAKPADKPAIENQPRRGSIDIRSGRGAWDDVPPPPSSEAGDGPGEDDPDHIPF